MTNDELILSLLKMVRKWQCNGHMYHVTAEDWRQSSDKSYSNKRYKQAKSEREYAISYEVASTNIYKCLHEIGCILYNLGVIKCPNIGIEYNDIQTTEEAIKQYIDKLEAGKDSASYICMAGYKEV